MPGHGRALMAPKDFILGQVFGGPIKVPDQVGRACRSALNWKDFLNRIHGSKRPVCSEITRSQMVYTSKHVI